MEMRDNDEHAPQFIGSGPLQAIKRRVRIPAELRSSEHGLRR